MDALVAECLMQIIVNNPARVVFASFFASPKEGFMPNNRGRLIGAAVVLAMAGAALHPAFPQTIPTVVSTVPADGAVNVSRSLAQITVTFNKAMKSGIDISAGNWAPSQFAWSADLKTLTITRTNTSTLLYASAKVIVILGSGFQDTEGNSLSHYEFSFTTSGANIQKVEANPQKGFSWPYYLYIPDKNAVKFPVVLVVEPNNTGASSNDQAIHDAAALSLLNLRIMWADDLGSPYLVPTFPRPVSDTPLYTHALDRNTVLTKIAGLERIDLQLIAMIEDARTLLAANGVTVDKKVFLPGASASGSFVSRFVMMHPDVVKAASIGAPGFGPIVPVGQWNGVDLPYPEGVSDLEGLVGKKFDAENFRSVPLQVWVGDEDTNVDMSTYSDSDPEISRINSAFGGRYLYQRWPRYEAAYYSGGSSCQFVVFPGMAHTWASWQYMQEFFERNRTSPQPPLPKPLNYKIYFPHVASSSQWETEIAVVNTVGGGVAVRGVLQAYGSGGGQPLESATIEISPGGREEITTGTFFQNPGSIAYLAFVSDSGFVAGYTRFNQAVNRASLPATTGSTAGYFPKMETDGWTGLALINIESTPAAVTLTATDENGGKVNEQNLTVGPGAKVLGLVSELFHGDLSKARFFSFSSDKKLLGFSVSGSADGQKLDGLPSLPEYVKP